MNFFNEMYIELSNSYFTVSFFLYYCIISLVTELHVHFDLDNSAIRSLYPHMVYNVSVSCKANSWGRG